MTTHVADLYETLGAPWDDRVVLLANRVGNPRETAEMLEQAHALGLQVLVEYALGYDPRAGDYVHSVSEPWAYRMEAGERVRVSDDWAGLFAWVRSHAPAPQA